MQKGYKFCVVGGGPSGFYFAKMIAKQFQCEIDIFEKMPCPFGLVRYGVGPDKPDMKNCANDLTDIKNTLGNQLNFFGNIQIGTDLTLDEIQDRYSAVIYCTGANEDKNIGIQGEENSIFSRQLINWYNGYPGFGTLPFDLQKTETITIIGNGNVSVDIARILLQDVNNIKSTEVPLYAIESLSKNNLKKINVVTRSGPIVTKATTKELRMLSEKVSLRVNKEDLDLEKGMDKQSERAAKRKMQLIRELSDTKVDSNQRHIDWRYFLQPHSIQKDSLTCLRGKKEIKFQSDVIISSIGANALPLPPVLVLDGPNKCKNVDGKISDTNYCGGWIKCGALGTIANTIEDVTDVSLVMKNNQGKIPEKPLFNTEKWLKQKGLTFVDWQGWQKIDKKEVETGKKHNKIREKVLDFKEMVNIANS